MSGRQYADQLQGLERRCMSTSSLAQPIGGTLLVTEVDLVSTPRADRDRPQQVSHPAGREMVVSVSRTSIALAEPSLAPESSVASWPLVRYSTVMTNPSWTRTRPSRPRLYWQHQSARGLWIGSWQAEAGSRRFAAPTGENKAHWPVVVFVDGIRRQRQGRESRIGFDGSGRRRRMTTAVLRSLYRSVLISGVLMALLSHAPPEQDC